MNKSSLSIVYMGTPEFAVAPLRALLEAGYRVVGVVTSPDKPAGRGMKLQASPVKQFAVERGLPVLQPEKLKDEAFLDALRTWKADLQLVVAFRMLPEVVWSMPPMGTFNLHASLLPQYRGAAPIHWAVMNGETQTGVTTFMLQQTIDTGDVLLQEALPIGPSENTGSVHDRLMNLGADVVVRTVDALLNKEVQARPQHEWKLSELQLKSAPKLFKDNTCVDWSRDGKSLYNFIRGLSPFPTAWSTLVPKQSEEEEPIVVKVFEAAFLVDEHTLSPGTLVTDHKKWLHVAVNDGFLSLLRLQSAGRKQLSVEEWLRGFPAIENWKFHSL
jgi:methionyl-tRNA formyltransferase